MTNHPVRRSGKGPKSTDRLDGKDTRSRQQRSDSESDDAVTPKTPKVTNQRDKELSDQSTDEEVIISDEEIVKSDGQDGPQYASVPSEEEEITQ